MSRRRFPVKPAMLSLLIREVGLASLTAAGVPAACPMPGLPAPIKCLTAARRGARPSSASPHVVSPAARVGRAGRSGGSFLGHEQVWLGFEGTGANACQRDLPVAADPARIGKMCLMILPTSVTPTTRCVRARTSRSGSVAARRVCSRTAGSRFWCAARRPWTPSSRPARAAVFVGQQVDRSSARLGCLDVWLDVRLGRRVGPSARREPLAPLPPPLASCCTSPQWSGRPCLSPRQSTPADACAGRCWQLLNHPAS